ncbi:MAG: site-2 protease family protein, partial [Cyanobacteria bacterium J083]
LLTFLSTTLVGAEISGVTAEELTNNPQLFWQGLPYSLGLIAILAAHEFAHFFFIRKYKIDSTLPYFIPFPFFLGTFGAFIQKRSPVPHRQALFDIAIAGPIAGLLVTLPLLIAGLSLSDTVAITTENGNNILNFQALDPRFSFFLALISKLSLGQALEPNMAINLHPLAVAGYLGVIITALNLMPVGQLDGGHIAHAMFGQGKAVIIGQVTRFLAIALALVQPYLWVWVIFLWLIPLVDQPTLNDVTDLSDWRDFCGLLCFALLIIILLPLPHTVAQWLNI